MTILTTSTEPQGFKVIPNNFPPIVNLKVTDENTNVTVVQSLEPTYEWSTMILTGSFGLQEGHFYFMEVEYAHVAVYRGRVFCTDQTGEYNMTSGSFKSSNDVDNIIMI